MVSIRGLNQDLRYALRALRRDYGFTLIATAMLGLALAVNGTLLALVDRAMFFSPPAVQEPTRLVRSSITFIRRPDQYTEIRRALTSMDVAGQTQISVTIFRAGPQSEMISARFVTRNYFAVLGTTPIFGRQFSEQDVGDHTAILAYRFWKRRFAGDRDVIGTPIHVSNRIFTVIGVAPADFNGVEQQAIDIWLPADAAPKSSDGFWPLTLGLVGRLHEGTSIQQAQSELSTLVLADDSHSESTAAVSSVTILAVHEDLWTRLATLNRFVLILIGAAMILLVIACVNVAGLLISRALERREEILIRLQLGAPRSRLVRQLLIEVLLLSSLAGACAVVAICWAPALLHVFLAAPLGHHYRYTVFPDTLYTSGVFDYRPSTPHLRILIAMGALAFFATCLSGLAPSSYTNTVDVRGHLGMVERKADKLRGALLALQVALMTILLTTAGMFGRSLRNTANIDFGIDVRNVIMASMASSNMSLDTTTADFVITRLRQIPSVTDVSVSSSPPLGRRGQVRIATETVGYEWPWGPKKVAGYARPYVAVVSPPYFSMMRLRLLEGRAFVDEDTRSAPLVAVIDQRVARDVFRGKSPLGECVRFAFDGADPHNRMGPCRRIVGIVGSVRLEIVRPTGLDEGEYDPAFYVPFAQWESARHILVKSSADAAQLLKSVTEELQTLDASLQPFTVELLSQYVDQQTHGWKVASTVFSAFGILSLIYGASATYSVLAIIIKHRTHEVGIRMALGASPWTTARLIIRTALLPVLLGVFGGVAGIFMLRRVMSAFAFGVSPMDPITLAAVALGIVIVSAIASFRQIIVIARMEPAISLRYE